MQSKDLEFYRETGRLSLDWIATLGERHGTVVERLSSPEDFAAWQLDIAERDDVQTPTYEEFNEALDLRSAIIGLLEALYANAKPAAHDIDRVNTFAALPRRPRRLDTSGRQIAPAGVPSISNLLGDIARDAVELATGDDFAKMKLCAAEDCSVFFVDHSRPGKRRWCSMSRCGNKAKKSRFNARKA